MTTNIKFAYKIAKALLALGANNVSRHLDELACDLPSYSNYGEWCYDVFKDVLTYLRDSGDSRTIVWVINGKTSYNIRTHGYESLSDVFEHISPPTIYLLTGGDIFGNVHEEYRKAIASPDADNIKIFFRSWRDDRGTKFGWEFNNDVYIWTEEASQASRSIS